MNTQLYGKIQKKSFFFRRVTIKVVINFETFIEQDKKMLLTKLATFNVGICEPQAQVNWLQRERRSRFFSVSNTKNKTKNQHKKHLCWNIDFICHFKHNFWPCLLTVVVVLVLVHLKSPNNGQINGHLITPNWIHSQIQKPWRRRREKKSCFLIKYTVPTERYNR